MRIIAICLLLLITLLSGQALKILKFQSNSEAKKYSTEEWARFKGKIPRLNSFTVCHWERLRFFSVRDTSIWAFCVKTRDVYTDHQCTQFWYNRDTDSGGRYVVASGGFGDNSYGGITFINFDNHGIFLQMC